VAGECTCAVAGGVVHMAMKGVVEAMAAVAKEATAMAMVAVATAAVMAGTTK
jgi:hypothetical protein